MRFFTWVDFQFEILAIFMGLITLVLIYIAWASYPRRRIARTLDEIEERRGHELQTAHDVEKNPIAPLLIFVYVGIAFWSVSYVIYILASSTNF